MKNILIGSDIVIDFENIGYSYIMNRIGDYIYDVKRFNSKIEYNNFIKELNENNILFVDINLIQFLQLSK